MADRTTKANDYKPYLVRMMNFIHIGSTYQKHPKAAKLQQICT
jgi:hypothetical protein